jgi:hypothetical protein
MARPGCKDLRSDNITRHFHLRDMRMYQASTLTAWLLIVAALLPAAALAASPSEGESATLLSDDETWKTMPKAEQGSGQPLPSWAKAVAVQMPRTAAAMLELDLAQRTKSPLDPVLRAKMRGVIAHANRCAYSEATALADLKRAGADDAVARILTGDPTGWRASDREPLEFARLLTVFDVKFAPGAFQSAPLLPPQAELPKLRESGTTVVERDPEWSELSFDELQSRLDRQRTRAPRLPVPTWDEVKKNLPPEFAARPTRIVWNLVCSGYVPELAVPWGRSTRTMWAEAAQDRVFEESLFWIQTRSIRCNYCMGHCEMLLEVAGLDKSAVLDRTRRLASDDWSAFPPAEQRAYAYARKLSKTPWALTPADYKTLEADLGPKSAMATFWWLCRGLYMTRVSDGFQLPLERDNVFGDYDPKDKKPAEPGAQKPSPAAAVGQPK